MTDKIIKGQDIAMQPNGRKPYDLTGHKLPIEHFVVRVTRPDNPFKPHKHEAAEAWFVLDGQGVLSLDGQEHPVEKGDLILLEAWVEHGLRSDGEITFACIG